LHRGGEVDEGVEERGGVRALGGDDDRRGSVVAYSASSCRPVQIRAVAAGGSRRSSSRTTAMAPGSSSAAAITARSFS
jgi:hypothetical protein